MQIVIQFKSTFFSSFVLRSKIFYFGGKKMNNLVSNAKKNFAFLMTFVGASFLKAESQLASTINTSGTSSLQEAIKIAGNIGVGIAVLAICIIIIGGIWDSDRIKAHTTKLIVAVIGGGIIKAVCSISTSNFFG